MLVGQQSGRHGSPHIDVILRDRAASSHGFAYATGIGGLHVVRFDLLELLLIPINGLEGPSVYNRTES